MTKTAVFRKRMMLKKSYCGGRDTMHLKRHKLASDEATKLRFTHSFIACTTGARALGEREARVLALRAHPTLKRLLCRLAELCLTSQGRRKS